MDIGSEEWKEWRKTKITATDAPVILGKSPYKTAYKLWRQKKGLDPEDAINSFMKRGIEEEPKARDWYNKTYNMNMQPKIVWRDDYQWMVATLDGIDENERIGIEIKANGKETHFNATVMESIPDHHWIQIQHQLAASGLERIDYVSWDGSAGTVIGISRSDHFIKEMINLEKEWYEKYIIGDEKPPMTEKDYADMEGNVHFDKLCREFKELEQTISNLEMKKDQIKEEIVILCNNQNASNSRYKVQKIERKGSVDYSSIPELKNVNLDIYRKNPSVFWKIT